MKKKKPYGKSANIDWNDFEKLCALHCTQAEIADWFDISPDTIDRAVRKQYKEGFAEVYKKKSAKGKISLRRKMYETAMGGSVTMMIWLSKNMLGYSDNFQVTSESAGRFVFVDDDDPSATD